MLGTESNGMQLAVMFATYARNAKANGGSTMADVAMYTFHDAMERTALAIASVLDAKRLPRESFDIVIDYSEGLREMLEDVNKEVDDAEEPE